MTTPVPRPTVSLQVSGSSRPQGSSRAWLASIVLALLALTASACASTATVTVFADSEQASAPAAPAADLGDPGDLADAEAKGSSGDARTAPADATGATGTADRSATSNAVAFAATPSFLAYAAEQVEAADSYRFEMFQEIDGGLLSMGSRNAPLMAGATSGTLARIDMDLGSMMGAMAMLGLGNDADLTMNMVIDGETMYLNAPFFGAIMDMDPNASLGMPWLDTIANGWGAIDIGDLGGEEAVGALGESFGMGASDATALLDVLNSVGEVLDGGSSEVRGVPTRVAYATVDLQNLMDASGNSTDDLGLPPGALDQALPVSLEVHIDDANRVRRLEYVIDLDSLLSAEEAMRGMDMSMWQRIDFLDFGQPVEIAVPVGAPDITAEFAQLAELGG